MAANSLIHNNSDILAAISIQTTGQQPRFNDLIQVGVLPIGSDFKPIKGIIPFYLDILPRRIENVDFKKMKVRRENFVELLLHGIEADRAADHFDEWYQKLPLKPRKKLIPICYNWTKMYGFLEDWLGYENVNHHFSHEVRDVLTCAMYENDKADAHIEQIPYPKHETMSNLCIRQGVENRSTVDPLTNCMDIAALYKRMLVSGQFTPIGSYIEPKYEVEEEE